MILTRYSRFMKHRNAVTPCSSFLRLSLYEESEVSKMSGLDEVYDAVEAGVAQERHPVVISKHRISSKRPFYRDGEKKVRPLRSERSSRLDRLRFATLDTRMAVLCVHHYNRIIQFPSAWQSRHRRNPSPCSSAREDGHHEGRRNEEIRRRVTVIT